MLNCRWRPHPGRKHGSSKSRSSGSRALYCCTGDRCLIGQAGQLGSPVAHRCAYFEPVHAPVLRSRWMPVESWHEEAWPLSHACQQSQTNLVFVIRAAGGERRPVMLYNHTSTAVADASEATMAIFTCWILGIPCRVNGSQCACALFRSRLVSSERDSLIASLPSQKAMPVAYLYWLVGGRTFSLRAAHDCFAQHLPASKRPHNGLPQLQGWLLPALSIACCTRVTRYRRWAGRLGSR